MPDPAQFSPDTSEALSIGGPGDLLLVGSSFDRAYEWLYHDAATCTDLPVDFTGYNVDAEILDISDAVIGTFDVTPVTGDATGKFALHLDPFDVNTTLRDNAVKWQIRISVGSTVNVPLTYVPFTVT